MANMTLVKTPMPEQYPQVRARNFKEVTETHACRMEAMGKALIK